MSLKIYKDIDQQSEKWFKLRADKFTASHAGTIMTAGIGLETLVAEMMCEQNSENPIERFSGEDTERGNKLEDQAVNMYEIERNIITEKVSFVELDENVGCSPDRFVGEDGLLEVKNPDHRAFMKAVLYGISKVDKDYVKQCKYQLYVTGRKWNDLLLYNENYNFNKLIVFRITLSEQDKKDIEFGLAMGKKLLAEAKETINNLKK